MPITGWDRVLMATIGAADFLASGAVIVSLGLALAIWVRRLGRAVALCVTAYAVIGAGWIALVAYASSSRACFPTRWRTRPRHAAMILTSMSLSPIFGTSAKRRADLERAETIRSVDRAGHRRCDQGGTRRTVALAVGQDVRPLPRAAVGPGNGGRRCGRAASDVIEPELSAGSNL